MDSSHLLFCGPGFESQAQHLRFFQFILLKLYIFHLNWNVTRTKVNKKRSGLAHLKNLYLAVIHSRYWAVTHVHYIHSRTFRTIGTMILMIWLTSVIVSLAPLFGWKDPDFETRVNVKKECIVRIRLIFWHLICSPIHPRLLGRGRRIA